MVAPADFTTLAAILSVSFQSISAINIQGGLLGPNCLSRVQFPFTLSVKSLDPYSHERDKDCADFCISKKPFPGKLTKYWNDMKIDVCQADSGACSRLDSKYERLPPSWAKCTCELTITIMRYHQHTPGCTFQDLGEAHTRIANHIGWATSESPTYGHGVRCRSQPNNCWCDENGESHPQACA